MFLGLKGQKGLRLNISENKVSAPDNVKQLGIETDNKLKFSNHVETLCSKVNKKSAPVLGLIRIFLGNRHLNLQCGYLAELLLLPFDLAILQQRCVQRD